VIVVAAKARNYINETHFQKLCALQCTKAEIASFFECSEYQVDKWCNQTFGKGYKAVWDDFSQIGKVSLRRIQFRLAEKDSRMAIFLGKNYLGQSEQPVQTYDSEAARAVKQLTDVLEEAASKYGVGATSSPAPEQEGAAEPEGETADASPLLAYKGRIDFEDKDNYANGDIEPEAAAEGDEAAETEGAPSFTVINAPIGAAI